MPKRAASRRSSHPARSAQPQRPSKSQPLRLIAVLALVVSLAIMGVLVAQGHGLGPSAAAVLEAPRAGPYASIAGQGQDVAPAERLKAEVLATRPHDPNAFTQGLFLFEGSLYESTGLYGRSSVRQVDPTTGEVLREYDLSPEYFGEGMTNVGERLVQITWREGVAPQYDIRTFAGLGSYNYSG